MAATTGVHLIAAAASIAAKKPQNPSLFLTSSRPKITYSSPQSSLQAFLLHPILSISSPHRRLFTSSFPISSYFEDNKEGDQFEKHLSDEETEGGQQQRDQSLRSSSLEARRLFVGNLPFSITSSELSEIFSQSGKIDQVEIIYGGATHRSRGFAFVTMVTLEDANKAIRMFDGAQIGGRTVKVNFPEVPKGGEREVMGPRLRSNSRGYVDTPHKIYAGNLGWTVTSEDLRNAFSAYSGLVGAKVIYELDSGRSRGFGFVVFGSAEDCQSALYAMDGKMLEGRPLRLNIASERASSARPLLVEASAASDSYRDEETPLESNLV